MTEESGTYRLLSRLNRWRWKHGILTGRWTEAEVRGINERAKARAEALALCFEDPGGGQ